MKMARGFAVFLLVIHVVTAAHLQEDQKSCFEEPGRKLAGTWTCDHFSEIPKTIGPDSEKVLHVNMRRSDITELQRDSLTPFPNLLSLNLEANRITSIDVLALSACVNLEILDLSYNNITLNSLPRCWLQKSFLRTLNLSNNKQLGSSIAQERGNRTRWLKSHSLRDLDLSFCGLSQLPEWVLSGLPFLSELDVSGNQLTTLDPLVPAALCRLNLLSAAGNNWDCDSPQNTFTICILRTYRVDGLFCHRIKSCGSKSDVMTSSKVLDTTRFTCLAALEARQPPYPGMSTRSIVILCLSVFCVFVLLMLLYMSGVSFITILRLIDTCSNTATYA